MRMYKRFLEKWILLGFLIVFSFFMSLKTSFVSFRLLFWVLLTSTSLGFLWLFFGYITSGLSLERRAIKRIDEDEFLEITLTIRHRGIFPLFDLTLQDEAACTFPEEKEQIIMLERLDAGSSKDLSYLCFCYRRGRYEIGPVTVYFFDPLGLFYLRKTYPLFSELYVYPRRFTIRKFPSLNKGPSPWFNIETCRVSGDDDEVYGVREYRRGDPLKRVHWMATARKRQLIVKEFQRQSFFRATILFDLEKEQNVGLGKECVAEYMIKIVASIATYLTKMGVSLEIVAHAGELVHIPFNRGGDHLESILKFLTIAQAESMISLGELYESCEPFLSQDSSLIVIMTDRDKAALPQMFSMGGKNVALVPVVLLASTFMQNEKVRMSSRDYDLGISDSARLNPIYIACGDTMEDKF
jgi:uncharacterized protein (DUF58 family)